MKIYLTREGADRMREEYQRLFHEERPKLVETIAWAASNGDRSENADYIYGKRRLREIDRRLKFLIDRLDDAEIVNVSEVKSDKIVFGAYVDLEDENEKKVSYQIVGVDEVDVENGKISWNSPLGRALLGKEVDDEVKFQSPKGEKNYLVLKISYK